LRASRSTLPLSLALGIYDMKEYKALIAIVIGAIFGFVSYYYLELFVYSICLSVVYCYFSYYAIGSKQKSNLFIPLLLISVMAGVNELTNGSNLTPEVKFALNLLITGIGFAGYLSPQSCAEIEKDA
jgi:hypothetical protein